MLNTMLFILLQSSRPQSGAEAILIGLISGGIIFAVSAGIRAIKKATQKENEAKKNK
jgi:hypothetical protein